MDIFPLDPLLKIYKDKNKVFQDYLDNKTFRKLNNKIYYDINENDIYLNDNITLVKKNTGKIFKIGKVISIEGATVTIHTSNNYITINLNNYYTFIKQKKHNRDFYKALLNSL